MTPKRAVGLLVAALLVYFVLIGFRGFSLLGESSVALKILGVAVLVLPLIGIVVVVMELRFGVQTQRLAEALEDDPDPTLDTRDGDGDEGDLPRRPSGRIDRAAADAVFVKRKAQVEQAPDDWRRWYLLAVAYDDAGDRKRARAAMRSAIARAESVLGPPPPHHV